MRAKAHKHRHNTVNQREFRHYSNTIMAHQGDKMEGKKAPMPIDPTKVENPDNVEVVKTP